MKNVYGPSRTDFYLNQCAYLTQLVFLALSGMLLKVSVCWVVEGSRTVPVCR